MIQLKTLLGVKDGMNSFYLNKETAIHEIGHNLGGEHSDGTSDMDLVLRIAITSYSYPSMNNKFTKIIFQRRDTPRKPFSGEGKL